MKKFDLKKVFNKRIITLVAVCLLLVGAVGANVLLSNKDKDGEQDTPQTEQVSSVTNTSGQSFFDVFRNERDSVRTQEIAYLDAIVAQGADEATISDAQQQKLDLVYCMELEVTCENLIKAKGFEEVIVSMHKGSVNVIVGTESLTDEQVAQILDIVLRETGEAAENVKVSTAQ